MENAVENMTDGAPVTAASRLRGMFTRRNTVAGTVGIAGIVGGLVAGAGMFAGAATAPTYNSEISQCAGQLAALPATPIYQTRFTVGGSRHSGTIPAITAQQLASLGGVTPTLVNVNVTTQYNSGRSGANKTDVATVNVPGHQYNNPLLFNIPPVTNNVVVGSGAVNYSVKTTGRAFATVTVTETVAQATSTTPELVLGTTCPVGPNGVPLTKVGSLSGQNFPAPVAPTNVSVAPGGATANTADTAPNNGALTVTFTPSANTVARPAGYELVATDVTNPNTPATFGFASARTDANNTAPQTGYISGLNTGDTYTVQVFAVSDHGVAGAPSASSNGVKPTQETVVAPTSAQGRALQQAKEAATKF